MDGNMLYSVLFLLVLMGYPVAVALAAIALWHWLVRRSANRR
jgi:TRAP-type mannitol/chloroaromatic compound transport system permease large subunit